VEVVGAVEIVRRDLGDGQPPAYLFTSPCCGARSLLAAWIIEYARRHTAGRLLIPCGRYGSDPLGVTTVGCGRRYLVEMTGPGKG
jgi:hypothetical protein